MFSTSSAREYLSMIRDDTSENGVQIRTHIFRTHAGNTHKEQMFAHELTSTLAASTLFSLCTCPPASVPPLCFYLCLLSANHSRRRRTTKFFFLCSLPFLCLLDTKRDYQAKTTFLRKSQAGKEEETEEHWLLGAKEQES